jgi:hypothetical protein
MLITYRVTFPLRAHNIDQVKQAIENAFGSIAVKQATISVLQVVPKDADRNAERKD